MKLSGTWVRAWATLMTMRMRLRWQWSLHQERWNCAARKTTSLVPFVRAKPYEVINPYLFGVSVMPSLTFGFPLLFLHSLIILCGSLKRILSCIRRDNHLSLERDRKGRLKVKSPHISWPLSTPTHLSQSFDAVAAIEVAPRLKQSSLWQWDELQGI